MGVSKMQELPDSTTLITFDPFTFNNPCVILTPPNSADRSGGLTMQERNKTVAGILALFLGGLGAHKFYLGRTNAGILYLIFSLTLIPAIIALFDAIKLFTMSEAAFQAEYGGEIIKSGSGRDTAAQLADFAALRDSGALTEEEFAAKKAELLR